LIVTQFPKRDDCSRKSYCVWAIGTCLRCTDGTAAMSVAVRLSDAGDIVQIDDQVETGACRWEGDLVSADRHAD
jgi:hypothetical protein